MKKIITLIICPLFIFSQDNQLPYSYISIDEYKSINIEYNTQINIESNTINTKFLNSMLFGGYIDDTLKDKWINNTNLNNTIYSHFLNKISFFFSDSSSNKHPYSIGFGIIDKRIINTNFSDDIMKLILYGNYHYQNESHKYM